ncbi:MAG: cytidylyltransferase [Bacteroidetes bacterium]|nr:cytidylyltransferase [Bacteroidota bacterium]
MLENKNETRILITLCARGGSKGIPGKNIKPINNIPLIAYSISAAQKFGHSKNVKIALSTDSNEIKSVAASFGLQTTYNRPAEYSRDETGKIETIKHLLDHEEKIAGVKFDIILDLDVTSPFRNTEDLEQAFHKIISDEKSLNLFSVSKAHRNPYFNMVEQKENGYFDLIKKGVFKTRQSAPPVYDLNASFYFYKRKFFELDCKTAITDASMIYVMPHMCFDLDHPVDFEFMEFLLKNNKLDFEL